LAHLRFFKFFAILVAVPKIGQSRVSGGLSGLSEFLLTNKISEASRTKPLIRLKHVRKNFVLA
jgi:hypothetical protein